MKRRARDHTSVGTRGVIGRRGMQLPNSIHLFLLAFRAPPSRPSIHPTTISSFSEQRSEPQPDGIASRAKTKQHTNIPTQSVSYTASLSTFPHFIRRRGPLGPREARPVFFVFGTKIAHARGAMSSPSNLNQYLNFPLIQRSKNHNSSIPTTSPTDHHHHPPSPPPKRTHSLSHTHSSPLLSCHTLKPFFSRV